MPATRSTLVFANRTSAGGSGSTTRPQRPALRYFCFGDACRCSALVASSEAVYQRRIQFPPGWRHLRARPPDQSAAPDVDASGNVPCNFPSDLCFDVSTVARLGAGLRPGSFRTSFLGRLAERGPDVRSSFLDAAGVASALMGVARWDAAGA